MTQLITFENSNDIDVGKSKNYRMAFNIEQNQYPFMFCGCMRTCFNLFFHIAVFSR